MTSSSRERENAMGMIPASVDLDKWVANLRSGKYKQGVKKFKKGDRYCAIGLLLNTIDPLGWYPDGSHTSDWSLDCWIPRRLRLEIQELNDEGFDFGEIADFYEAMIEE